MFFFSGINWWVRGGGEPAPLPDSNSAMTGMSGIMGGDIDLFSLLLISMLAGAL